MLEEAKRHCDYLVVGLHVNPNLERQLKNKPIPHLSARYVALASCKYVDEIIPYETEAELLDLLRLLRPEIRFLGEDYRDRDFTGKDLGIEIHYCARKHSLSSSGIREQVHAAVSVKMLKSPGSDVIG